MNDGRTKQTSLIILLRTNTFTKESLSKWEKKGKEDRILVLLHSRYSREHQQPPRQKENEHPEGEAHLRVSAP